MKKRKSDNRGASLILVISVIALVSILVTVLLSMSLVNMQMKSVDKKSTDNFYDAEAAMDEIRLGLQQEIANAASTAYVQVMEKYADTNYQDSQRQTIFNVAYKSALQGSIGKHSDPTQYDEATLLTFISKDQQYKIATKKGASIITEESGLSPLLAITDKGLVLKNVDLKYCGKDDYVSEIRTDIALAYPQMNFTQPSSTPDLLKYCLVGNSQIVSKAGTISVLGSAYAGTNGLTVENASQFSIDSNRTLISKGNLNLLSGAKFSGSPKVALWTNDIAVQNNADFKVQGSTYVADDLQITGSAHVDLNGEYYGYGNPITAKEAKSKMATSIQQDIVNNPSNYSSAILVNGISTGGKSSIYMTGLTKLVLAGNAYVGNNTMMGESLSVKSNQIAYLVPEACIPAGETNPSVNNNLTIDATALADKYGAAGYNKITNSSSGLTYYFMNFSTAKAANMYFDQYYDSSTPQGQEHIAKRNQYLSFYIDDNKLTIRKSTKFEKNLNGNILIWDENGIYSMDDTIATDKTDISGNVNSLYYNKEISWQDMFSAYCIGLTSDYDALKVEMDAGKKADNVFANLLVLENRGKGLTDNPDLIKGVDSKVKFTYTEGGGATAVTYQALAVNNSAELVVDDAMVHPETNKKVSLIIATGDVRVTTDYSGLIIAGGKITISPAAGGSLSVGADAVALEKIIDYGTYTTLSGTKYNLFDYMTGAGVYTGNVAATDTGESRIDYAQLVTYENWSKE
jgi:Tfp pilus assembly protein PilX